MAETGRSNDNEEDEIVVLLLLLLLLPSSSSMSRLLKNAINISGINDDIVYAIA